MKRCLQYLLLLSLLFGQMTYLGGTPYSAPMAKVRENGGEWTAMTKYHDTTYIFLKKARLSFMVKEA